MRRRRVPPLVLIGFGGMIGNLMGLMATGDAADFLTPFNLTMVAAIVATMGTVFLMGETPRR